MLLWNQAVEDGWANGTQARLLAENSWSGPREKLKKVDKGDFVARVLDLEAKPHNDLREIVYCPCIARRL